MRRNPGHRTAELVNAGAASPDVCCAHEKERAGVAWKEVKAVAREVADEAMLDVQRAEEVVAERDAVGAAGAFDGQAAQHDDVRRRRSRDLDRRS